MEDPTRTRYLYGASAFMLRQGEVQYSQIELFLSSVGVGVSDHLSLHAESFLPALLAGVAGLNGTVALKAGVRVYDQFHLAVGAQAFFIMLFFDRPLLGGNVFSTATFGEPDAHVSLSVGVPFLISGSVADILDPPAMIVALSGNIRVGENVALVAENWLMPIFLRRGEFYLFVAAAARIFGERFSADIGGVWPFTKRGPWSVVPIPWLSLTYQWPHD
ncbi:MAG: hypothetical protein HYZ28_26915 [Myxococcales bacterium]|nr:hypothetical protein [Myxococcales bacterium]